MEWIATLFTAFNASAMASKNIQTLLILRFLAGASGSSTLTNAGGQIADLFNASERGLAMGLFALAPFLGPTIGPIAGGFLGQSKGWVWIQGLMGIFSGVMWLLGLVGDVRTSSSRKARTGAIPDDW
jgi:MFS family permease